MQVDSAFCWHKGRQFSPSCPQCSPLHPFFLGVVSRWQNSSQPCPKYTWNIKYGNFNEFFKHIISYLKVFLICSDTCMKELSAYLATIIALAAERSESCQQTLRRTSCNGWQVDVARIWIISWTCWLRQWRWRLHSFLLLTVALTSSSVRDCMYKMKR